MKKNIFLFSIAVIILILIALGFLKNPILNSSKNLIGGIIPTPASKALTKLSIIHVALNAAEPEVAVAIKNKIFEKYGLVIEVKQVASGNTAVQGLVGGQADIVLSGQISYIKAAAAGAKIKSVGIVNNNSVWFLVSRKDSNNIKTYCTVGLTTEDYLRGAQIMKNLGIYVNSLNLINLASKDLCAKALVSGSVDSMAFTDINWELFKNKNKQATKYKLIVKATGEKYLVKPVAIMVMENTLNTKKQAIENFSKAIIEANYWIRQSSESEIAKTIVGGAEKITNEQALVYAKVIKGYLVGLRFTQDIANVEANRKENESMSPQLKNYDVKNFLSTIISDNLKKQGFLQKYGF